MYRKVFKLMQFCFIIIGQLVYLQSVEILSCYIKLKNICFVITESFYFYLKGPCYKDIVVFGQLCAAAMTKGSNRVIKEMLYQTFIMEF